jgi:hypothetical protein
VRLKYRAYPGSDFSPLSIHHSRPERTFYLCPSRKRALACSIMIPEEFKKGWGEPLGKPPGISLQSLCVVHRVQQKVFLHRRGPSEEV